MTVQRLAADLAELVEALDLTDIVAVGWSLGAMVLWEVLLGAARARFGGLVVIDMAPRIVSDLGWSLGI